MGIKPMLLAMLHHSIPVIVHKPIDYRNLNSYFSLKDSCCTETDWKRRETNEWQEGGLSVELKGKGGGEKCGAEQAVELNTAA